MRVKSKSRPASALAEHRRCLRTRGLQMLSLSERLAAALADPERAAKARELLRHRFGPETARSSVAEAWAWTSAVRSVAIIDSFRAATASMHGLVLVTGGVADIQDLENRTLNRLELSFG